MNKKVIPEIQGDKVVLREWVGEEPKNENYNSPAMYDSAWDRHLLKVKNAPTYQHHPDHESYFRERIGVKTDVEIVNASEYDNSHEYCPECGKEKLIYVEQYACGEHYKCASCQQEICLSPITKTYAIPKQEDDLWEELLDYIEKFGKHLDREGMKTDLNFKYTIAKTTNNG